jgi:hypothetical protein
MFVASICSGRNCGGAGSGTKRTHSVTANKMTEMIRARAIVCIWQIGEKILWAGSICKWNWQY